MKRKRFGEEQMVAVLNENEAGLRIFAVYMASAQQRSIVGVRSIVI